MRLLTTYCYAALLLIGSGTRAFSTTVAVVYSDAGMVVVSDSKLSLDRGGSAVVTKIFKVQNRFAVAAIGRTYLEVRNPPPTFFTYDVPTWISGVEANLPKDVSFDGLMDTIAERIRSDLIPQMQPEYAAGRVGPYDTMDEFEPITTFVIAGHRNGRIAIGVVQFNVDWHSGKVKIVEPFKKVFTPETGEVGFRCFGEDQAITNILETESYAYKRARTILPPKTFRKWSRLGSEAILLDDSIALGRVMIEVEKEVDPKRVGGDVQIIAIPPTGDAYVVTDALPKTQAGKQKKKQ